MDKNKWNYQNAPVLSPDGKWQASITDLDCEAVVCTNTDSVLSVEDYTTHFSTKETLFKYKIDASNYVISWSPDSKWFATTGSASQWGLTIYPIDKKLAPLQIVESSGTIEDMDWSRDGKFIVVTCYNGVTYLYKVDKIMDKFFGIKNGAPSP